MNSWKRYIPEGSKDIMFEDSRNKIETIKVFRELYEKKGFIEMISPTLEFYDVFSGENISIEQEKMYKLFDSAGRILVLRPDMTTPIARIVATKLKDIQSPLKICYSGNIFRVNESLNGKNSEITQSGIEILGVENSRADIEVIITSIEALIAVGIKNFQIELGQAEFFKGLIEGTNIQGEELEKLKVYIETKNYTALRDFINEREEILGEKNSNSLKSLPELFGDMEVLDRARKLTNNERALKALDSILEICEKLKAIGLGKYITIDLGMIQHIHYYTGIIFRGYSNEIGTTILSGGRYDNLISQFGKDMPAVGFAVNVDNIMLSLEKQGDSLLVHKKKMLIYSEDVCSEVAYKLAKKLRKKDIIIEMSLFDNLEASLNYCKKNNLESMISLVEENIVQLIDVDKEISKKMSFDEFISRMEV